MDLLRQYFWLWLMLAIIFVCLLICIIFALINKCIPKNEKHRSSQRYKGSKDKYRDNKYRERNQTIPPLPPRTQFGSEGVLQQGDLENMRDSGPPGPDFDTYEGQSYENIAEVPNQRQETMSHDLRDHQENKGNLPEHMPIQDQNRGNLHDQDQNLGRLHNQDWHLNNDHSRDWNPKDLQNQGQNLTNFHKPHQKTAPPDTRDCTLTHVHIQDHYLSNLFSQDQNLGTRQNQDQNSAHTQDLHHQDQNLTRLHNNEQIPDEQPDYVEVEDQDQEAFPLVPSCEEVLELAEDTAEEYDDVEDENQDEKDYDDIG